MGTRITTTSGLRTITLLVAAYVVVSVLAVAAVVLLRDDPTQVNDTVWVRSVIVAATSFLTFAFARRAAAGSARGLLRLRIAAPVILVALVVFVVLPGVLPTWMRVEQGVCAVLLLGVVALANSAAVRAAVGGRDGSARTR